MAKKVVDKKQTVPAVQPRRNQSIVEAQDDFAAMAGAGMENVTSRDILIPRIGILQDLSPQLKASKPEYIKGAKRGDICDVGTGKLIGEMLHFLPVYFDMKWIEWKPNREGLVRIHDTDEMMNRTTLDKMNFNILPSGNIIIPTAQWYGFNITDGVMRQSFIPMSRTQLGPSRKWMTMASEEKIKHSNGSYFQAPLFYRGWQLKSVEKTDGQNDWFIWEVSPMANGSVVELYPDNYREILASVKTFLESVSHGRVRGDVSGEDGGPRVVGSGTADDGEPV